jgi:hypothetical protein
MAGAAGYIRHPLSSIGTWPANRTQTGLQARLQGNTGCGLQANAHDIANRQQQKILDAGNYGANNEGNSNERLLYL